jgi:hypothetical protein
MLYSLFIYQTDSGLLLWDKSFEKDMDSRRVELFSSFFSAIQSFVKEMITTGSKGLKNIEMGNFSVNITNIPKLGLDIVAIIDKGDEKPLTKFVPKILKLLQDHGEIFRDWDGNRARFKVLDLEIFQIIQGESGLIGSKTLTENRSEILSSIMEKLPDLEKGQREQYEKERDFLTDKFQNTTSITKKIELLNSIENISQKLKDRLAIEKCERDRKKYFLELQSTKEKLKFFLLHAKEAISRALEKTSGRSLYDIDFKDAYLNLYSFSTKLKIIGRDDLSDEYRNIAQMFLDKPLDKQSEFSHIISKVLNLNDNIESYVQIN